MGNMFGALVGAAIDRQDGDSGIKGAIIGTITQEAIRIAVPIVATYALGWAVEYAFRKGWKAVAGSEPVQQKA